MKQSLTLTAGQPADGLFTNAVPFVLPRAAMNAGHYWFNAGRRGGFYRSAVLLVFQLLLRFPAPGRQLQLGGHPS